MADKRFNLFGFRIGKKEEETDKNLVQPSFAPPSNEDGAYTVTSAAHFGMSAIDMDGSTKNEIELITRYREIAMQPEVESAVDDIVNEAIVRDDDGKSIEIVMDNLKQPDKIKKAIDEEFRTVLRLLNYENMCSDIFRRYYIDGRLFYHIVLDIESPQKGIQELRYIDPRKIKKIREVRKQKDNTTATEVVTQTAEYYVYSDRVSTGAGVSAATSITGIKISPDSIININSGLMDSKKAMVLSYLHKAIKPLNQLRMIEDAIVIYRLSRAPERRVFYVDVGNLPRIKAEQHVRDMMTKYKNKLVYDGQTGEVRDDRRHLCLTMDTKVPLLDGRTLTLEEIAAEYKEKQLWVYSCDTKTGKFSPGLVTWAGVSKPNAQVMRLTLDNGKTIDCTPEHKFPVWENGLTMAKELKVGDSLIPLYRKNQGITPGAKQSKQYEQIWQNDEKKWIFTHKLVSVWKDEVGLENEFVFNEDFIGEKLTTIHHKNINRFDNTPENLIRMNHIDHILFHRSSGSNSGKVGGRRCYEMGAGFHNKNRPDYMNWRSKARKIGGKVSSKTGKSQENFVKGRKIFFELMQDPEYREWFVQQQKNGWTEETREIASERAKRNNLSVKGNLAQKELWKTEEKREQHNKRYAVEYFEEAFNVVKECVAKKYTKEQTLRVLNSCEEILHIWKFLNKEKCINSTQKSFDAFIEEDLSRMAKIFANTTFKGLKEQTQFINHKIINIQYLSERVDTGCLTVDGEEKYHKNHTFALDAGVYTQNSMMEDFWMPRRSGDKTTEITTLPAGQNLGQIEDIQYFEKKLYKSLNVPVTRLDPGQAVSIGRSTEITRDELKFAKFIDKLRNKFSELFDQALRVQLVLKGVCTEEEWKEFKEYIYYDFIKDNNFVELKEAELMQERLGLLAIIDQYSGKYYSKKWIQQNVLRLNDLEIEEMEDEIQEERQTDFAQQSEDQEREVTLQAQQQELMAKLMPPPQEEQQIDAGAEPQVEEQPQQTEPKKNNNPYIV